MKTKNTTLLNGIPVKLVYEPNKISSSAEIIFEVGFNTEMMLQEYNLPHILNI